jgi:hypothetical protein
LVTKKFIAAYVDKDFFDLNFAFDTVQIIDKKLLQLNVQIEKHNQLVI